MKSVYSFKKSLKIPKRYQNPWIVEEQTTQWPKEKVLKDKQRFTKHYTWNSRSSNTNPTKTGGELNLFQLSSAISDIIFNLLRSVICRRSWSRNRKSH